MTGYLRAIAGLHARTGDLARALLCVVVVIAILVTSCASQASPSQPAASTPAKGGSPIASSASATALGGKTSRAALFSLAGWENLSHSDYAPSLTALTLIKQNMRDAEVIVFVGTSNADSKREVPRFFKIADDAGFPETSIAIYGLDKDAGLSVEAQQWNVTGVPSFVFVRQGRETGRIVEKPRSSLEEDMAEILARKPVPTSVPGQPATISAYELKALLDGTTKPQVFDARAESDYKNGHVPGAVWMTTAGLATRAAEVPKDRLSVFYCYGST